MERLKLKIAKHILHRHKCPICNYPMDMCQCLYGGSCHPDRDKLNRLKSLLKSSAQVKDESVDDTLMDLANYAIMTLIERKEN